MAKSFNAYVVILVLALVVVHTSARGVPTEAAGGLSTSATTAPTDAGLKDEKHFLTFGGVGGYGGIGGVAGIVGLPTGGLGGTGGTGGASEKGGAVGCKPVPAGASGGDP